MPTTITLTQLKNEILSRLGSPILTIEVTNNQVERCIDRAIELFVEKHHDGTNIAYGLYKLNVQEAATGIINFRNQPVTAVTTLSKSPNSLSAGWYESAIFDQNWHLSADILKSMSQFGGFRDTNDFTHLESWHQYYELAKRYFSPDPDFHYNGATRQLRIYDSQLFPDQVLLLETMVASIIKIDASKIPDTAALKPFNTPFCSDSQYTDQETCELNGEKWQFPEQDFYNANVSTEIDANPVTPADEPTYITQLGFDDRWFKDYCTALVKLQWGQNTSKFKNVKLLGDGVMNGQEIKDEAKDEIKELKEELKLLEPPLQFWLG